MINEVEVKRAGTISGADSVGPLLTVLGGLQASVVLSLVLKGAGGSASGSALGGAAGAAKGGFKEEASALLKKVLVGTKVIGRLAGPMFLVAAVWGAFNYLPDLMQKSLEQLDTVEGILKALRRLRSTAGNDSPLKLTDITDKPGKTLISKSWSRKEMVDYIASVMELKEGKRLYSELIAEKYIDLNGKKQQGPLIGKDFSTAILKRRKSIKLEAAEKIKAQLLVKIKEGALSEEETKKLTASLSKVA